MRRLEPSVGPNRVVCLTACSVDLVRGEIFGEVQGRLTDRERSVLRYLVDRPGTVVSRAELLEQVFHYNAQVRTRVVDKAICTLRRKIERDRRTPDHLLSRRGEGYVFVPASRTPPASIEQVVELLIPLIATWLGKPAGRDRQTQAYRERTCSISPSSRATTSSGRSSSG